MESNSPFQITATIALKFKNEDLCDIALKSFLPEFNLKTTKRSKISMDKQENSIVFFIQSNDITAFRASISEIVSLGKVIENSVKLIEDSKN